jgi:hypothetical protein
MSDLTMLSSTSNFNVYCDAAEGNIPVGVLIFSYIADLPENRSIIGQALGNGLCSPHMGYCGNVKLTKNILRYCPNCGTCLMNNALPSYCSACACWKFLVPKMRYIAPGDYPRDKLDPDDITIPFTKLTRDILLEVQHESVRNYVTGKWSLNNVDAYLNRVGVSIGRILKVKEYAQRKKTANLAGDPFLKDLPNKALLTSHFLRMTDFVEGPVHLLFLGCRNQRKNYFLHDLATEDNLPRFASTLTDALMALKH